MNTRAICTFALLATAALCAVAPAAERASIPAVEWRSILPTGTKARTVHVNAFQLDRTPVTNRDFLAFVRKHPEWQRGRVPAAFADEKYLSQWSSPTEPGPEAGPQQPVTSVSWFAARAYCESQGARLPTWYEWEVAASADEHERDARTRAGWQQTVLNWYSHPSNHALARVGSQQANVYGVRDLHGLVWEWVEDFNALFISGDSRTQGDPDILKFCGSGALSIEDRDNYALAMRLALLSSLQASSTTTNLGFRCAKSDPRDSGTSRPPVRRAWPADSLYQADASLQGSDGHTTSFAATRGQARIVTMFYSSCQATCPLTIETLRNIDASLSAPQRARVDVLLLSMDPERDTPEALRTLAREHHVTNTRWLLARASLSDTRKLAALLGIQYRALDSGDFEHASVLVLLDAEGRVLARSSKLGAPDPTFVASVRAALGQDVASTSFSRTR